MSNISYQELNPPYRILLGPGPSNIHPRVQMAMLAPLVGHLDPYFISVMEDTVNLLRVIFRTKNELMALETNHNFCHELVLKSPTCDARSRPGSSGALE